ncbi:MAG: rhomboid family intramembrane serine protease [Chloroflexi bacterium]|nr:MAG: rhomboid family intramembrane serine protease [Chloroflexota bacterium]
MLPLNDAQPNRYTFFPFMTVSLIAVNTVILIWELSLPEDSLNIVFYLFGFTPSMIWARQGFGMISNITSAFLHGDIYHLLSNMLFLWVFGRRVEDACGPLRFLVFYLLAGTTAHLVTAIVQSESSIPSIGASGAIFGVMGAYLVLFSEGRIRTLLFFFSIIPTWPKIRAFWFVLYYLIIQIPPALDVYFTGARYGIGYWAHLGGFFACIFIPLFIRPEAFARYLSNVSV